VTGPRPATAWFRVVAMTHRGAVRPTNEDSVVVGPFTASGVDMPTPVVIELPLTAPAVVAVADGMGGHAAGEIASAHVVAGLSRARLPDGPERAADLTRCLTELHDEVRGRAAAAPELTGMGTTVAGLVVAAAGVLWFGVGDSRVYREQGGFLTMVSTDDRAPGGGLTQCLGGAGDRPTPRVAALDGPLTGRLLVCTDGLSDLVALPDMEEVLARPGGSVRAVKALWVAAMNASGRDNVSIVLVETAAPA
jgi:serine/threonine protein phosphatase PrpC